MTFQEAIPLTAVIISLATLVFSAVSLRKKAGVDYVQELERRLSAAEKRADDCERERTAWSRERIAFLERLAGRQ